MTREDPPWEMVLLLALLAVLFCLLAGQPR
jgi:hypothetical protein